MEFVFFLAEFFLHVREALCNKNPNAEYRNPWPRPDPKGRVLYDSFPNIPETAAYFKHVAPGQAETMF